MVGNITFLIFAVLDVLALNTDDAVGVINDCFQSVHYWLDANGLRLNPDKTEAIVIGTS